uniref:hypothetical protein n=1 Tax=Lachnoclostridium phocaeense TaxID=1871021 RepID=UPI0026DD154E|nr:hypothetical protein [Lachnoclostridium phocaeense]
MGWTSYHAVHYTKSGSVDRKKECDSYISKYCAGELLRAVMYGAVYYAAVKMPSLDVIGVVILTTTDKKNYCNISIKVISEDMGPCYYDCPQSILELLSPTVNEWARSWRDKCYSHNEKRKTIQKLKLGSTILVDDVRYVKSIPFGHKKSYWIKAGTQTYLPIGAIIDKGYAVIEEGIV